MANKLLAVGCSFLMPRKGVIPQVQILADTLDYELVNRSIAGNGNQHIIYHVIDEVQKHDYELVCIGWSNPGRWDYITKNNKWFAHKVINFMDDINKDIDLDQTFKMQWCPQVLMLTEYLRSQRVNFVMWNSLKTPQHPDLKNISEFYASDECHIEHLRKHKQYISKDDHHPDQQSHEIWADKILDHVQRLT